MRTIDVVTSCDDHWEFPRLEVRKDYVLCACFGGCVRVRRLEEGLLLGSFSRVSTLPIDFVSGNVNKSFKLSVGLGTLKKGVNTNYVVNGKKKLRNCRMSCRHESEQQNDRCV